MPYNMFSTPKNQELRSNFVEFWAVSVSNHHKAYKFNNKKIIINF